MAGIASAARPQAGTQAPGFYRYTLGQIEVTVVNDGVSRMPVTDGFVSNVPKAHVTAALTDLFIDPNVYAGPYNPIVVNTG
ncbi:MAG: MBL fold metallo-hydrolase, partial [Pseudolabrys sp.]